MDRELLILMIFANLTSFCVKTSAVDHISYVPWVARVHEFDQAATCVWRNLSESEDIEDRIVFCNVSPGGANAFYFARQNTGRAVKIDFDATVNPADLSFSVDSRWMHNPSYTDVVYRFFKENEPSNFPLKKHLEELGRALGTNMPSKIVVGRKRMSAIWPCASPYNNFIGVRVWNVSPSGSITRTFSIDYTDEEVLQQIERDPNFVSAVVDACGRTGEAETAILSISSEKKFVVKDASSFNYYENNRLIGKLPASTVVENRIVQAGAVMAIGERPLAEIIDALRILLPFNYETIKPILHSLGLVQHPSIYLAPP